MNRREFLKLIGMWSAGTVVLGGCTLSEDKRQTLVAPLTLAEERLSGVSSWYATACESCSAGCGIIVRVLEGRAKKIEGNPDHPINRGKLCARGQAALQILYNPDRLRSPLKRVDTTGSDARGSGDFVATNWEEGLGMVAERLSAIQSQGTPDALLVLGQSLHGSRGLIADRFARAFGGTGYVGYEPFGADAFLAANRMIFGQETLPDYDLENTNYVLSFGANLLETWLSPVRFGRGFGDMRQGRPGRRGRLVQIEPRLSLTAARADEWIPINPGTEGLLALGIGSVIVSEGLISPRDGQLPTGWASDLAEQTIDQVSQRTGVAEDEIRRLAREFASSQPGIAVGGAAVAGHTNGVRSLAAINALNSIVGSVGRQGGLQFSSIQTTIDLPRRTPSAFSGLRSAIDRLNSGNVDTVIVLGANPVFTSPKASGVAEALQRARLVVSFSSFLDETSRLADLILPESSFLERWGDSVPEYGAGYTIYGTMQPVVNTLFDTRPTVDALLSLAHSAGGQAASQLTWNDAREVVMDFARQLQRLERGSIRDADVERFSTQLLQKGGWWDRGDAGTAPPPPAIPPSLRFEEPNFEGSSEAYPFHLHVYQSITLSDGQGANLPWLQELPDPMTTAVWSSWVEINPNTADRLGLRTGDAVWIESPMGQVLAPILRYPGAMPDVISIPVGQGHTSYGQYAQNRGANPLEILAPLTDSQSGSLAHNATRVKVTKATEPAKLITIEKAATEPL